jgi:Universal stress protein family
MKKILVAIDGSPCALKALEYVGEQFSGMNDLQITLTFLNASLLKPGQAVISRSSLVIGRVAILGRSTW